MKKPAPVAIVGAGLSGLSCAQALQAAGVGVRVFERASVVGGRCATQLWQGHLVDLGVQYFTAQSGDFKKELLTRLRQFRPIVSPILDKYNQPVPNPAGPRFYVLQGNNYFAHVLSHGLDVRLNTEVETVSFQSSGIKCLGETYRAVVSSLPGPQTARLFDLPESPGDYEPCLVALLEYAGTDLGRSHECYGRVLPGGEPVQASYCENNKVGRIVGNKTVFVVEAGPNYSREFANAPSETYLPDLILKHEEIWGIPGGQITAAYGHCWNFARPIQGGEGRRVSIPPGGFICGDSRTESTVENVWLDGQKAAREVLKHLQEK